MLSSETEITVPVSPADVRSIRSASPWPTLVAAGIFLAVTSVLLYQSTLGGVELRDFRDAVYYPVVSLLDGNNPYDTTAYFRTYPVQQEFPPYLPGLLAVHLPFGWVPFETAQLIYFAVTAMLTVVLAYVTLLACGLSATVARACWLGTLLILSRPGRQNLVLGQVTVPVVIGTYLALAYGEERPWLGAFGLAVALLKPTYGLPVSVLLLARKNVRVVVLGSAIAGLVSVGPLLALAHAAGGFANWIASLRESYAGLRIDPSAALDSSPYRVDAAVIAARLLGHAPSTAEEVGIALVFLGIGALAVWRIGVSPTGRTLSNSIACLTVLTCTYHLTYDLLLLALPLTALAIDRWAPSHTTTALRWPLITLLAVPAVNYISAGQILSSLQIHGPWWTALTSVNGCALIAALCLYLTVAVRRITRPS
jgi:hypothetical protein